MIVDDRKHSVKIWDREYIKAWSLTLFQEKRNPKRNLNKFDNCYFFRERQDVKRLDIFRTRIFMLSTVVTLSNVPR